MMWIFGVDLLSIASRVDCPRLQSISFFSNAFANYSGKRVSLSLQSLPALQSLRFGKESFWNCQSVEMKSLPALRTVVIDSDALYRLKRFHYSHIDPSVISAVAVKRMYIPSQTKSSCVCNKDEAIAHRKKARLKSKESYT